MFQGPLSYIPISRTQMNLRKKKLFKSTYTIIKSSKDAFVIRDDIYLKKTQMAIDLKLGYVPYTLQFLFRLVNLMEKENPLDYIFHAIIRI